MKIAMVVGRGFEGAGIQMYISQLTKYLKKNDIEYSVFVVDDKKWGRENMQEKPEHSFITKDNIETFADTLNKFDYVFIHSVPSIKHSDWAQRGFLELVKKIETKKIIFQNDHKLQSIHRNANFLEICNLCDGIVSHSITSPFYKKLVETFGGQIKSKFIQLHVGFNFEPLYKYRKDNHWKKITYLGRYATFKQPDRLFAFLPYAAKNNILLEMKGVERSLGALPIFYEFEGKKMTKIPRKDIVECSSKAILNGLIVDNDKRDLNKIYVFGPYEHEEAMETLSSSLVGADFYHLSADSYGDNFEYAQCEIVGVGTVPMFDYHWAENCWVYDKNGNKTNKRFIDLDEYGLFVKKDLSNVEEIVNKINEIYSNKNLHKKYLEHSLQITKDHCDSNWIFNKLIEDIQKIEYKNEIKSKALF